MTTLSPRPFFEPVSEAADGRTVLAAAAGGVALDVAVRSGVVTLGGALATAIAAGALVGGGRLRTPAARASAANAVLFGAFLAVRTSEWLVAINLGVVAASVLGAVLLGGDVRLGDLGPRLLGGRLIAAVRPLATGVVFLAAPVRRMLGPDALGAQRRADLGGIGRGVLLAVPVLAVLGGLLASADAVFASFARVDHVLPGDLGLHLFLLVVGTVVAAGLLHAAAAPPGDALPPPRLVIGAVEWTVVLVGVVGLFAAFAAAQVVAASEGGRRVLATEGLTYAEYARSGYFQLLAVAVLTAALLVGLGAVADRSTAERDRRFGILGGLAVLLTLVVLATAVRRLALYEDAYGWTMLRLMVKASAVWLGVAFVLLGLRLGGVARHRSWLLPAVTAVALMVALALNLADPEAAVVRHNVARAAAGHEFDPSYLTRLSDDAVPPLVASLATLPPETAEWVRASICTTTTAPSGLSWNLAAARAASARQQVCP